MFTITCNNCNQSVVIPTIIQISKEPEPDMKTITYLDSMTLAQAWQKLIVDADIPYYEWTDVKSFYPVDKKGETLKEKPTGKMVTWKTPNVLDLSSEMCGKSADERLKEETEWLSPVAYLHWVSELWKEEKHLDAKTWTQFPDWRNDAGYVLYLRWNPNSGRREVIVGRDHPQDADDNLGTRPVFGS